MSKWGQSNMRMLSGAEVSTLLSKDAEIRGTVKAAGSIRIDGTVIGDINCSKTVTIGATGAVDGNITAEEIIVSGSVKGSLHARGKILLEVTAHLDGDIHASKLTISEGASFRGFSHMGTPAKQSTVSPNGQSKIGEQPKSLDRTQAA